MIFLGCALPASLSDLGLKGEATPVTFWSTPLLAALLNLVDCPSQLIASPLYSDHAVSASSFYPSAQVDTCLCLL